MGLFLALTIGFRPQRRLGAMVAHRSCKAGVTGSSPVVGSLVLSLECNTHRVDAVAISSWGLWRIIKYVSEVTAALRASNLGADHAVGSVLDVFNRFIVLRLVETWPTAVGVKLGICDEQERIAATAVVASLTFFLK